MGKTLNETCNLAITSGAIKIMSYIAIFSVLNVIPFFVTDRFLAIAQIF